MMFLTLTVPGGKRMVLVCSRDGQPMHAFLISSSLRKFLFLEVLRKAIPDQISLMFASLLLLTREINSTLFFFFLPCSHSRSKACFFFLHQWVCVWLISYSCIMYNDKSCVTRNDCGECRRTSSGAGFLFVGVGGKQVSQAFGSFANG